LINLDSETDGKIFTQEDVKLFRVKGVLAILDTPFYDYSNTKFLFHNPTPVKDSSNKRVGFANVYLDNNKLMADVILDYFIPDRLDIDIKNNIYLSINGFKVEEPEASNRIDLLGHIKKIQEVSILSLSLTHKRPIDNRIEPLGELVLA